MYFPDNKKDIDEEVRFIFRIQQILMNPVFVVTFYEKLV
jgi:hypothetical protein